MKLTGMGSANAVSVSLMLSCCLLILAAASSSVMAGHVDAVLPSIEDVIPSSLVVPEGNELQQVLFATGVQIYVYNGSAWVLNNVSADLYDFKGRNVGFHYFLGVRDINGGQPTWQTYCPASSVTGRRLAAVPQTDSIDWLLLTATSNSDNKFLGLTRFIQRLFTQHGLPPSAAIPAKESDVFRSNYTALYTFSTNITSVKDFRRSTSAVLNTL